MGRPGPLLRTIGHRVLILGFTAFAVFPFYWMAVTAFKQNADLYVGASNTAHNPFIFNRPPTLEHLHILFGTTLYPTWLFNTLWVGGLVVWLVATWVHIPAAHIAAGIWRWV